MIDVLITKVHDKERFFYYCALKFRIRRNTILAMTHDINRGHKVKLCELPECDIRYLQQYVCTLKIIKYTPMRKRINPASFVNEEGKFQKKEKQPMEKHQFKPFDQVLVRDSDKGKWLISHYGYETTGVERQVHVCSNGASFYQCVPYNENTAHLVGTTEAYTPPQPKTYQVIFVAQNGDRHQVSYTDDEFKKFIEIAVLNNKDVSNFDVRRICG